MIGSLINIFSTWTIPAIIFITLVYGNIKGVKVFDVFVEGAREGFDTAVKLIPFLVAMLVAISLFRQSGAMETIVGALSPFFVFFGIPMEVLPLAVMRPISGSSALAITTEMLEIYGPDSLLGRIASTMQGSTDTTFFVLTVYFGSVGIKKVKYSLTVGLLADLAGFLAAVYICHRVFN